MDKPKSLHEFYEQSGQYTLPLGQVFDFVAKNRGDLPKEDQAVYEIFMKKHKTGTTLDRDATLSEAECRDSMSISAAIEDHAEEPIRHGRRRHRQGH